VASSGSARWFNATHALVIAEHFRTVALHNGTTACVLVPMHLVGTAGKVLRHHSSWRGFGESRKHSQAEVGEGLLERAFGLGLRGNSNFKLESELEDHEALSPIRLPLRVAVPLQCYTTVERLEPDSDLESEWDDRRTQH
jgi:hypothetical protein